MTTIRDLIEAGKVSMDTVVLGELPMTADGCIVGLGSEVFYTRRGEVFTVGLLPERTDDCYSTREAAQSAAEKGGG